MRLASRWAGWWLATWLTWWLAGGVAGASTLTVDAPPLRLAVYAYRSKAVMEERFRPLGDYLAWRLGTRVELHVLTLDELEDAAAHRQMDMLMTNPVHYVQLRARNHLTGALATLVSIEDGGPTESLGGVIIVSPRQGAPRTLKDLKGRRIGIPGTRFLGGYVAQAYELEQVGIRVPRDVQLVDLGSHDAVVHAVASGRVEAGFIRTGILERMRAESAVLDGAVEAIHVQRLAEYPYVVSTRLYPEWPFVVLPHLPREQVARIASALYSLSPDHPAARAALIAGFNPPADYLSVEQVMRRLRFPPFDRVGELKWQDVWDRYRAAILVGSGLTVVLAGLVALLLVKQRQLLTERARLADLKNEYKRAATHDALTGLPNRLLLHDRLAHAIARAKRYESLVAVAFVDLDGFKPVNDRLGHDAGDALLVALARRMQDALRETDTLARLGGDEFVAVLADLPDREMAFKLVDRLNEVLSQPFPLAGEEVRLSASIGVALYPADGVDEADQLVRLADQAMYRAKRDGKNRVAAAFPIAA